MLHEPCRKGLRLRNSLQGDVCTPPATVLGAPDMALQTMTEFAAQVDGVTRSGNLNPFENKRRCGGTKAEMGYS